jgi:hypothetical protein
MSSVERRTALAEEDVQAIINAWNDRRWFRIQYLGDKIFIDEIVPQSSYNVRLRTHYEERSVQQVTVAFLGGPVDEVGMPPGPWDVAVRPPKDFEERTEDIAIPHTDRVAVCPKCAGQGDVQCSACAGSGRVNCSMCGGRGYRERQEMRAGHDAHGHPGHQIMTVRDSCTCLNGRVTCGSCSGNGRNVCPTCSGSARVKTFDQLTVRFRSEELAATLDATDLPDRLVARASGELAVDEQAERIARFPETTPEVDRRAKELLDKSQGVDEREVRIRRQHLRVERVSIHEVRYMYAGVSHRLWIYGNERRIHAPGAPWLWKRMLGVVVGAVSGVVLLIVLLVLLLSR